MELPSEIWFDIAQYLSLGDKAASVLVCRSWNAIFISQLYQTIDLRPDKKIPEAMQEDVIPETSPTTGSGLSAYEELTLSEASILKYSHLIRELILYVPCPFPSLWELTPAINCLSAVYLDSPEKVEDMTYNPLDRRGLSHLLANNPQIRMVSFQHLNFNGASKFFRQVARHCHQLQSLCVMDSFFKFEDMALTLVNNPGLRRFYFSNDGRYYVFYTQSEREWEEATPRLGTLVIANIDNDVVSLNSDQLETLLRSIDITWLKVTDDDKNPLDEHELSSMLFFWPKVTKFQLRCSGFGFRAMNALGHCFDRLRLLDVLFAPQFNNWMYEVVLAACPQLVDFVIGTLDLDSLFYEERQEGEVAAVVTVMQRLQIKTDNVTLDNWACTGLQRFRAARLIWPKTIEKQKRAASHLLALKHLEVLQFEEVEVNSTHSNETGSDPQIYWKKGSFDRLELEQDTETRWMVKAWPNLEVFHMATSSFRSAVSHAVDD